MESACPNSKSRLPDRLHLSTGHALFAGALAANLSPEPFGILPAEVIDTISKHDTGWAMPDLDALEHAVEKNPESFIDSEVPRAVAAWTRSIYEAEKHTTLAGILTSRHFCLLAPRDENAAHQEFFRSETGRREDVESRTHFPAKALDRYTAALGFCDLLSLCLCSGLIGDYDIPLAHPADPTSDNEEHMHFTLARASLKFEKRIFQREFKVYLPGWVRMPDSTITTCPLDWEVQ